MDAIEELIEKIKQQQATISAQVDECSARIHKINPTNREHRGKQMKILQDCQSIKEKVTESIEKLGYEERDKTALDAKLDESEEVLKTLKDD